VQSGGGGGNLDAIWEIDGTTPTEVHSDATSVRKYAFYKCPAITVADFPKATSVSEDSFRECGELTSANFPNALSVEMNAFNSCEKLKSANFPKAESFKSGAFYHCYELETVDFSSAISLAGDTVGNCRSLTRIVLPKVTKLSNYVFEGCWKLLSIDFHLYAGDFGNQMFYNCCQLRSIILRSETMCTLGSVSSAMGNCYHMTGTYHATHNPYSYKDGCIYVPRALIDSYRKATNWSQFGTQFRVLEDVTVDGTTTGELDPSKVVI
jgi:hypothetical protein